MVLSNRKLKQKLRALTAAAVETGNDGEVHSIREQLSDLRSRRVRRRTKRNEDDADSAAMEAKEKSDADRLVENDTAAAERKAAKRKKREDRKLLKSEEKKKVVDEKSSNGKLEKLKNNKGTSEKRKKASSARRKIKKSMQNKENNSSQNVCGDQNVDGSDSNRNEKSAKKREGNSSDQNAREKGITALEELSAVVSSVDSELHMRKVYVGGIPYYSTEEDIRSFFDHCGTITEVDCMTFPESGKFRGIAILTYKTEFAAKRALDLDGADMGGLYLKVQPYKVMHEQKSDFAPQKIDGYNRIYAGNLSWDITEDDLEKFFANCQISSIRFGMDKETGEFRGYAHVDFSNSESLAIALKLDQETVCGRPVKIRCAVPSKRESTCKVCGSADHLSSICPNKKAGDDRKASNASNAFGKDNGKITSLKTRTCYGCGLPGHLSSACPSKSAEDGDKSVPGNTSESKKDVDYSEALHSRNGREESIAEDDKLASSTSAIGDNGKKGPSKKRRTCYVCGEPGHLSSACPSKSTEDGGKSVPGHTSESKNVVDYNEALHCSNGRDESVADDDKLASSRSATGDNGKKGPSKKRRTCYVCGEPGHLSSDCPTSVLEDDGMDTAGHNSSDINDSGYGNSTLNVSADINDTVADDRAVATENVACQNAGKKTSSKRRRRTCYSCGIPGHIVSECPNLENQN